MNLPQDRLAHRVRFEYRQRAGHTIRSAVHLIPLCLAVESGNLLQHGAGRACLSRPFGLALARYRDAAPLNFTCSVETDIKKPKQSTSANGPAAFRRRRTDRHCDAISNGKTTQQHVWILLQRMTPVARHALNENACSGLNKPGEVHFTFI
jgi:hypothetical protein